MLTSLNWLFFFNFSDKFKFAFQVALSLCLAYLIPMSMGWPQASTAATTVMLIASTGGRRESLSKGTMRVLGTILGAIIGLCLVGLFSQERFFYMLSASVIVSFIFYLRNAYRADPTLFMLIGVVMLMTSNGGDANGAFLYGVDRAFMTVFGVIVYTLVNVFIFPLKAEKNLHDSVIQLNHLQKDIFTQLTAASYSSSIDSDSQFKIKLEQKIKSLQQLQTSVEATYDNLSKECSDISSYKKEWDHVIFYCEKVTKLLVAFSDERQSLNNNLSYLPKYNEAINTLSALFDKVTLSWEGDLEDNQCQKIVDVRFSEASQTSISQLSKASVLHAASILVDLQQTLLRLSKTIECIGSVTESVNYNDFVPKKVSRFLIWDMENFKTSLKVFVMYWFACGIWVYFNPPGGYSFVIYSTIYMMLLSFLPVHPKVLLALFTFSFVIAVPSYVFILPDFTSPWEFGSFIFIYTFIAFFVFKPPVTILFMLGFFVIGISNPMHLNFAVLLSKMILFYLVVVMIFVSYYAPFSSKPEHLFSVIRKRYFRHASTVLSATRVSFPTSFMQKLKFKISLETMNVSLKKMMVWEAKLDKKYFNAIEKDKYVDFLSVCEQLTRNINSQIYLEAMGKENELVQRAKGKLCHLNIGWMLNIGSNASDKTQVGHSKSYSSIELELDEFFENLDFEPYSAEQVSELYIFINSQKNTYKSIVQCQMANDSIDWKHLQEKRF